MSEKCLFVTVHSADWHGGCTLWATQSHCL